MSTKTFLSGYDPFKNIPLSLVDVLKTYDLTIQKGLLDRYNIKSKIIPILGQKQNNDLSISTLYYTITAAKCVIDDPSSVYTPIINTEIMKELFSTAIQYVSPGVAAEVITKLIDLVSEYMKMIDSRTAKKEKTTFAIVCKDAFFDIIVYLRSELPAALGYAVASRSDCDPVEVGNTFISSVSDLNVGKNEDLRQTAFVDLFNKSNLVIVGDIGKAVGKAITAVHDKTVKNDVLQGASAVSKEVYEQVVSYLIEVRSITNNVSGAIDLCRKTNYDLECDLFKNITSSEDCVPDITGKWFGWSDDSIIGKSDDSTELSTNVSNILSKNHITGKNIQYVLGAVVLEKDPAKRKMIVEKLRDNICETIRWEATKENYVDIPAVYFVDRTHQILETLVANTRYDSIVRESMNIINEGIKKTIEEEAIPCTFNSCPSPLNLAPFPVGVRASQMMFNNIYRADTDEEMDKAMMEFARCFGDVDEPVVESNAVSKGARDASRKVQKGTAKAIRNVGGTAHEVKQAAKNAVDPMEKYVGQMVEKLKKADADERREVIIKGGVVPKVLRWIKRSIPLIAGAAAGTVVPAAAIVSGIAFLGFIASDKYLDARERRKILREIEDEIEIVNEKIDDSRGDNNKQKKYELIRIRNKLKRTQDRILYNLKE